MGRNKTVIKKEEANGHYDILKATFEMLEELVQSKADSAHVTDLQKYYAPEGVAFNQSYYERLASSLQNGTSSGMDRSIKFNGENRKAIKSLLCDCDFEKVLERYESHEKLYDAFREEIGDAGADRYDNDNNKKQTKETNWQKYARGLFDVAKFLKGKHAVGEEEISGDKIIDHMANGNDIDIAYTTNTSASCADTIAGIQKMIHGLGYALVCDWLKECGCEWLAKPDVHIKKVYHAIQEKLLGEPVNYDKIDNGDVIKFFFDWACLLKEEGLSDATAYKIDKMIWLICTGDFYLDKDNTVGRQTIIDKISDI